jgi:hypothetical protein
MSRVHFSFRCVVLLALATAVSPLPAQNEPAKAARRGRIFVHVPPPFSLVPAQPSLLASLGANTDLHVRDMTLADFARLLSQKYRLPVQLDLAGLQRAGVDPGRRISAEIKDTRLTTALKTILEPLQLAHHEFNGIVLITDRTRADNGVPFVATTRQRRALQRLVVENRARVNAARVVRQARPNAEGAEYVEVEVLFAKKVAAPTEEQLAAIRTELQKCFAAAMKDPDSCERLPDKLADCVAGHLPKEQAARYRQEIQNRRAHESEACVFLFVTLVDQELRLSEQQRQALVAALTPKWKPIWSQIIEMSVRNGDSGLPPVPDELIVPLLNSDQARLWGGLAKKTDDDRQFDPLRIGAVGTPVGFDN